MNRNICIFSFHNRQGVGARDVSIFEPGGKGISSLSPRFLRRNNLYKLLRIRGFEIVKLLKVITQIRPYHSRRLDSKTAINLMFAMARDSIKFGGPRVCVCRRRTVRGIITWLSTPERPSSSTWMACWSAARTSSVSGTCTRCSFYNL